MHRFRITALFLMLTLLLAACSSHEGLRASATGTIETDPVSVDTATVPAKSEVAQWVERTELEPTADNWSKLSGAYVQEGRWQEALEAADKALKLQHDHTEALYHGGLARLNLGNACVAEALLKRAVHDRQSGAAALAVRARAHQANGRFRLALYAADEALQANPSDPAAKAAQSHVQAMRLTTLPPDLASRTQFMLQDGDLTLYLYRGQQKICDRDAFTLFAVKKSGKVSGIPLGPMTLMPESRLALITMPDGRRAYGLSSFLDTPIVSGSNAWHLFWHDGAVLNQVLFLGDQEWTLGDVNDFARSGPAPALENGQVRTFYMDGASGTFGIRRTWTLVPGQALATFTAEQREFKSKLVSVGEKLGLLNDRSPYTFEYPLAPDAQLLRKGETISATALKAGVRVQGVIVGGQIVRLEVLQ